MTTDNNGQPPIAIHYRHNIFKAARQLLGILDGISADGQIDAHEAVFLDIWLRDQQFLRHVPDAIDLLDATGDLLKRDIITATQLSDLKQLVADVLRYNPIAKYGVHHIRDAINTLLGMCHGIVANRRLHNLELRSLHDWLTTTLGGNVAETWPGVSSVGRFRKSDIPRATPLHRPCRQGLAEQHRQVVACLAILTGPA